jgi:hypothetical protein
MASGHKGKADTRVWKELREKVRDVGRRRVKVGVIGNEEADTGGVTLPELAAIHEYGAPGANIEARPFLGFTLTNRARDIVHLIEKLAEGILHDKISPDRALGVLGAFVAAAVKNSITSRLIRQELAPATVRRRAGGKGQSDPTALLDSGQLLGAITWAVEERE